MVVADIAIEQSGLPTCYRQAAMFEQYLWWERANAKKPACLGERGCEQWSERLQLPSTQCPQNGCNLLAVEDAAHETDLDHLQAQCNFSLFICHPFFSVTTTLESATITPSALTRIGLKSSSEICGHSFMREDTATKVSTTPSMSD